MEIEKQIKSKVKCCACGESLDDSRHLNVHVTNKLSTWKFPSARNVLIKGGPNMAVAIICDQCAKGKAMIEKAIELVPGLDGFSDVIYHRLDELELVRQEMLTRPSPVLN